MRPIAVPSILAACLFTSSLWGQAPASATSSFVDRLTSAAIEQTHHRVRYVPGYVRIPYPNGDVPSDTGVCTDVIIRAYRAAGIDLQKEVHEDMSKSFRAYPSSWGLRRPDSNIDHRRVPNLATYFRRHGLALPLSPSPAAYLPGDLVTWDLGGGVPHIGIVVRQSPTQPLLVHNIGRGPELEQVLFDWKITGHYRFTPDTRR